MTPSDLIPPTPSQDDYDARQAKEAGELTADEPLALFREWFAEARAKEPEPHAMTLATVDAAGAPDARMVLLKDFDARGFVFYTNLESAKGIQLAANPRAALVFYWSGLKRQVRVRGQVIPVSAAEADEYFGSRARDARIGAWASAQSRPLEGRLALQGAIAKQAARFGLGEIPRPEFWSGYRLVPAAIEFWRDRAFRLHDRLQFTRDADGAPWRTQKLYP
jgi:pyridoxamine 5'-phosphate oxidase